MIRSLLKIIYWFVQLTICLLLLTEKWQPAFLPSVYSGPRIAIVRSQYKQRLYKPRPGRVSQLRPRLLPWRRLLFLLG